jgi:hypothetical protein
MTIPLQPRTEPPKPEDIEAQYGFVALIAKSVPEIGALMQQAVAGQWTADRFSLALAGTNWWKNTPETNRQWLVKQLTDPASAKADMDNGIAEVKRMAIRLGVDVGSDENALAVWGEAKLKNLNELDYGALLVSKSKVGGEGGTVGKYGEVVHELMRLSLEYGYGPPNLMEQVNTEAGNLLRAGMDSMDAWKGKLISYASAKYAPFADRLKGGETVMDIAQPYLESYARTLEMNPQDVAMTDVALQKALQGDGQQAATVWQFEQDLRKDPRWGKTNNAKESAAQALTTIGRSFGMIG